MDPFLYNLEDGVEPAELVELELQREPERRAA